jgi:AraC-like DNA-binding protein
MGRSALAGFFAVGQPSLDPRRPSVFHDVVSFNPEEATVRSLSAIENENQDRELLRILGRKISSCYCDSISLKSRIKPALVHRQSGRLDFEVWHTSDPSGGAGGWAYLVKPASLHLVLNQEGEGLVMASETRLTLLPRTTALFSTPKEAGVMSATRFAAKGRHEFLVLIVPISSVEAVFGPVGPLMRRDLGILRRWSERDEEAVRDFSRPPVQPAAEKAWFLAKVLEILALHLFRRPEDEPRFFCTMVKSNAHRYVREALSLLEGRLDESLDLVRLAQDVGCAPPYLSRLVKQETGKTLLLHLRALRIEKAAEMLSANNLNVTEVALEVGYQSLSHFSKAFAQEKGMTPSQFLKRQKGMEISR